MSENFWLLCRTLDDSVRSVGYAPLCVISFRVSSPHRLQDAQQLLRKYRSYDEITFVPDRLRWQRHRLGMMQKEVAHRVGITRAVYFGMEDGTVDCWQIETVDKLSKLFSIPLTDLLDEYNRFLYEGQGKSIETLRKESGLGKKAFARSLGISHNLLREWEQEAKCVSKNSWERYFKK